MEVGERFIAGSESENVDCDPWRWANARASKPRSGFRPLERVAQGIATPEERQIARKQRRYIVTRRPYYPSVAEMTEAMKWLADRGFGQAPKTVQIEGSTTTGFKMVFRRWAPGTDPASLPLAEMPKQIVVSERKMPEAPKNRHQNGINGHRA